MIGKNNRAVKNKVGGTDWMVDARQISLYALIFLAGPNHIHPKLITGLPSQLCCTN